MEFHKVLGPTLFISYLNDLCQLSLANGKIIMFADDTVLVFKASSWTDVFYHAQEGINKVKKWLNDHLLTLNAEKTKYLTFSIHQVSISSNLQLIAHACNISLQSRCSCKPLQRAKLIKYLGVDIDHHLSFETHINNLSIRLRKLILIFKNLRHIADRNIFKTVYFAICQSVIGYCITSWGGSYKSHMLKLERAQRAILKVSAFLPKLYSTSELYKLWNVLTVRQIFILQTILKKHTELTYNPKLIITKRRKGTVCPTTTHRTNFSRKFYAFLGNFLYNKINTKLLFYGMTKRKTKKALTNWLLDKTYDSTEKILIA